MLKIDDRRQLRDHLTLHNPNFPFSFQPRLETWSNGKTSCTQWIIPEFIRPNVEASVTATPASRSLVAAGSDPRQEISELETPGRGLSGDRTFGILRIAGRRLFESARFRIFYFFNVLSTCSIAIFER